MNANRIPLETVSFRTPEVNPSARIVRVFPRWTKATPTDAGAYFPGPKRCPRSPLPDMYTEPVDEVHISVAFTSDMPKAERIAESWHRYGRVLFGGPATHMRSEAFVPGKYIKPGYVITSRGCPRTCWFCDVWRRENDHPHDPPRELKINDGWNILDDNLLACSRQHVEAVFAMLNRQGRRCEFTGGLEARALEDYQVGLLADMTPRPNCFFAYDPGDPFETLQSAGRRLIEAGFTKCSHRLRVYVLIGFPNDTLDAAEKRMEQMMGVGFTPFAMLWQPDKPSAEKFRPGSEWHDFRRHWSKPAIIHARSSPVQFAGCGITSRRSSVRGDA
jgi:hypothetical protein